MLISDLCLKYLEHLNKNNQGPLVILLHGRAANEADLFDLAPQLEIAGVILSVRAPIHMGPDSYGWFYTAYPPNSKPIHDPSETEQSRVQLIQFIQQAQG